MSTSSLGCFSSADLLSSPLFQVLPLLGSKVINGCLGYIVRSNMAKMVYCLKVHTLESVTDLNCSIEILCVLERFPYTSWDSYYEVNNSCRIAVSINKVKIVRSVMCVL